MILRLQYRSKFLTVISRAWAKYFERKMKTREDLSARFVISCSKPVNWAPLPASIGTQIAVQIFRFDSAGLRARSLRGFCWRVNHSNGVSRDLTFSPSRPPPALTVRVLPILLLRPVAVFRTFTVFLLEITAKEKKNPPPRRAIPR